MSVVDRRTCSAKGEEEIAFGLGEGLTGSAYLSGNSVLITEIKDGDGKECYLVNEVVGSSFIAVPVMRGKSKIGIISVSRTGDKPFRKIDLRALEVIASQTANIIENARLFIQIHPDEQMRERKPSIIIKEEQQFHGLPASTGYAFGEAVIVEDSIELSDLTRTIPKRKLTKNDLEDAMAETELQLGRLQQRVENKLGDAASLIFTAHLLMLKEKEFLNEIFEKRVRSTLIPTFPHRMVESKKLESFRIFDINFARRLPAETSTSRRNLLTLKNARLSPENIADWVMQNVIPIHVRMVIFPPTEQNSR